MEKKNYNLQYASVNIWFWAGYGMIWAFISPLLISFGMTGGQVGIVTSLATFLSVFAAPALSAYIDGKKNLTDRHGAIALVAAAIICVIPVCLFPGMPKPLLGLLFVVTGICEASVPPFQNAMSVSPGAKRVSINYGLCRGCGSVSYAVACLLLGGFLEKHSVRWLLPMFLIASAVSIFAMESFRTLDSFGDPKEKEENAGAASLLGNRCFFFALLGSALFMACHSVGNTYVNYLVDRVGGDESAMGLCLFLCSGIELPAMAFFSPRLSKYPCRLWFMAAALGGVVKYAVFFFAPSIGWIYFGELLQFFEFSIYLPTSVYYVSKALPASDQLKGQSFIHIAGNGLGAAFGNLAGGQIIERTGSIRPALLFAIACSAAAMAAFSLSERRISDE